VFIFRVFLEAIIFLQNIFAQKGFSCLQMVDFFQAFFNNTVSFMIHGRGIAPLQENLTCKE
jgi:hypothetical protein